MNQPPDYYLLSKIECRVLEEAKSAKWQGTPLEFSDWSAALEYIYRLGDKGKPVDWVSDARKAAHRLELLASSVEKRIDDADKGG